MARTTAAEVQQIIDTEVSTTIIDVMITPAKLVVTSELGGELSSALLTEIEKWLAAHLIKMSWEKDKESVKIGEAEEKYAKLGLNLDGSTYGQTVKLLDTTGKLANLGKKEASITAVESFE